MDIKITDEQIKEITEKQIMNIIKPRVGKILNENYGFNTYLKMMIEKTITENVNEFLKDNKISDLVKKEDIAKGLGYAILNVISDKNACNNLEYYDDED